MIDNQRDNQLTNCFIEKEITNYYKIKKEKKRETEKREKGTSIHHMTERKRHQNLAKCCSVLCKAE